MKDKKKQLKTEESTIFSDPKKGKETKLKSRKGLIGKIIVILLVVLVALPWAIVKCSTDNGNDKKPTVPFSTRVQRTEVFEEGKAIFAAKNSDVNDLEADNKLIDLLKIAETCGEFTVEVSSNSESFRLTFCFTEPHDKSRQDWFENTMVGYACVLLATIKNVDEIGWSYPDNGSGDNGGYFTRDDAEEFLGVSPTLYGNSEKSVQLLLNDTGVFPY